jgi:hypothetical protein
MDLIDQLYRVKLLLNGKGLTRIGAHIQEGDIVLGDDEHLALGPASDILDVVADADDSTSLWGRCQSRGFLSWTAPGWVLEFNIIVALVKRI